MTLDSPPGSDALVEWKDPGNIKHKEGKSFSLSQSESQKSGTWTCTISKDGKKLVLNINIYMLGKRSSSSCRLPPASAADRPFLCSHTFAPVSDTKDRGRLGLGSLKVKSVLRDTLGPPFLRVVDLEVKRNTGCKDGRDPREPWRRS